jgi:hypothetical protein
MVIWMLCDCKKYGKIMLRKRKAEWRKDMEKIEKFEITQKSIYIIILKCIMKKYIY